MDKKYIFICSSFYKLNSGTKGTVINVNSCEVSLSSCYFESITSSTWPGVIYGVESLFYIQRTSFFLCYACGGNAEYGRICYLDNSDVNLNHFSAEYCSDKLSNQGDSTTFFNECTMDVSHFNSSFCSGTTDGSGSLSIWYNHLDISIRYLNVVSCVELCCLEIFHGEQPITCWNCNFVNATQCNGVVNALTDIRLYNSLFIDMPSNFNNQNHKEFVEVYNCYSEKSFNDITMTITQITNTLKFIVYKKKLCDFNSINPFKIQVISQLHLNQFIFVFILPLWFIIWIDYNNKTTLKYYYCILLSVFRNLSFFFEKHAIKKFLKQVEWI